MNSWTARTVFALVRAVSFVPECYSENGARAIS